MERTLEPASLLILPGVLGVCIFVILSLTKEGNTKYYIEAFTNFRTFKRQQQENTIKKQNSFLLFLSAWLIISSVAAYLGIKYINGFYQYFGLVYSFLIIGLGIFMINFYKNALISLSVWSIGYGALRLEAQHLNRSFLVSLAVFTAPILFLFNYSFVESSSFFQNILYLGAHIYTVLVFVGFYLWRIIQELRLCSQINISPYYIILYFCTLEILPIIIVFGWIKG